MARPSTPDFDRLVESFDIHLRAERRAEKTRTGYLDALRQLRKFLVANGFPLVVRQLTSDQLSLYFSGLTDAGQAGSTVQNRWRSIQQFIKWLIEEGKLTRSPLAGITKPHAPETFPAVMTAADLDKMLATCSATTFTGARNRALISLLLDSGVRLAEATALTLDDIDLRERTLHVRHGKGDRERWAKFGFETARRLNKYLDKRADHPHAHAEALWLGAQGPMTSWGVESAFTNAARHAGLKLTPHSARHGYAIATMRLGAQQHDVMTLLGHRSTAAFQSYGRLLAGERARHTYDQFSPVDNAKRKA